MIELWAVFMIALYYSASGHNGEAEDAILREFRCICAFHGLKWIFGLPSSSNVVTAQKDCLL